MTARQTTANDVHAERLASSPHPAFVVPALTENQMIDTKLLSTETANLKFVMRLRKKAKLAAKAAGVEKEGGLF